MLQWLVCLLGVSLWSECHGSYCLRQDVQSNQYPYEFCTSDLRCCPGEGCCQLSASCCYLSGARYSSGCCDAGSTCCSDSSQTMCCDDVTQECCTDSLGNAACCRRQADKQSEQPLELVYVISIVCFAIIIAIVAVCAHVRANRQVRNNVHLNRVQAFQPSPDPTNLNDYDNMDMLPGYKERTPPPTYDEIVRITEAIDAAVAAEGGEGTFLELRTTTIITNNTEDTEMPTAVQIEASYRTSDNEIVSEYDISHERYIDDNGPDFIIQNEYVTEVRSRSGTLISEVCDVQRPHTVDDVDVTLNINDVDSVEYESPVASDHTYDTYSPPARYGPQI